MSKTRNSLVLAAVAMASVAVVAAPAEAAQGQILGADQATAIKDSYIVVLKGGKSTQDLPGKYGAKVKSTYSTALQGFSATISERQARELAADPAVAYVEQDQIVRLSQDQLNPPSWGTDRVDQRTLPLNDKYSYATTASNVTAYIIDSGITISHEDFGGRATHGRDTVDDDNDTTDCLGHGTHVAGTVGGSDFGLAKGVKLVGVRVFGCGATGSNTDVIDGIEWVLANAQKPAVANLSLGGSKSTALDNATKKLIDGGITTIVAAGNENSNACDRSPANLPEAITVGASNRSDQRWPSSNWGTCLDLFAPGQDIVSAKHNDDQGSYATSGTSMATPQVAGAAALYLSTNTSATHLQVRDALVGTTTPNTLTGIGTGSPNKLLYTGAGSTPESCATKSNGTDVTIPDAGAAVTSTIELTGCTGSASTSSKVAVDIKHTYRGDLVIDLVAPDGTNYRLKSANNDSTDNVVQTFTANLSSEVRNGTWKLKVQDVYRGDIGKIDTWSLTL
ncbi:MAG: S8 family serine peptidase [Actinomycetota bacterium]|nr:S8 family serine peptidase [Actinomycetota bacterium]